MRKDAEKGMIAQIKNLEQYLSERSREELEDLFAYGEEMKVEGEMLKQKFWENYDRYEFLNLLGYSIQHKKEMEGKYKYLDMMNEIEREKFVKEYLYDNILYSGIVDYNIGYKYGEIVLKYDEKLGFDKWIKEVKNQFRPGVYVTTLGYKEISPKDVKKLAEEWKDNLHPCMTISLHRIGDKGVEKLLKEWKESLQPGMEISLSDNEIGSEGVEKLAKEWKDSLQPGMKIDFKNNNIGTEGAEILAKEWKDCLKPGMEFAFWRCNIGDKGAQAIIDNMKLKNGVKLDLLYNNISDEMKKKLKAREKENQDKGIKCEILV